VSSSETKAPPPNITSWFVAGSNAMAAPARGEGAPVDESVWPVDDREKAAQADNASGRRRHAATHRPKAMTIRRIR